MTDPSISVHGKIARLRGVFIKQLPARMQEARRLLLLLEDNPLDHEAAVSLHRFFHSIKGTGNSFGLKELGEIAAQGETLAAVVMEQQGVAVPGPAQVEAYQQALADLDRNLQRFAAYLDAQSADEGNAAAETGKMPNFQLPPTVQADNGLRGGKLVYLCDDEVMQVYQLSTQLNCFGYHTITFTEPEQLCQAVLSKRPDALIMDINFPEGMANGTQTVTALRQQMGASDAVPTIFLSGRDDFTARLDAVRAGGAAYFHKPARALDIVSTLDELTVQKKPEPFRVLVVDDEPSMSAYHSLILEDAGMITCQVNDPAKVLSVLQEFGPDIMLTDMYMPGCTGRELAAIIRQMPSYLSLPIIYLSSETDERKQFSALSVGAEGFLTKPILPEFLIAAVATRAERMRTLRALMARDSLTGLYNHTTLTQMLESALASAGRQNQALSFAMIDVDHFKSVNDTYGHPVGDQVLLALARVLQQRLRNSDVVGRYGGEEFAAVFQGISQDKALEICDQLRSDFAKVRFHAGRNQFSCTFSVGIASFPQYKSLVSLREAADRCLYAAKEQGRNRVVAAPARTAADKEPTHE